MAPVLRRFLGTAGTLLMICQSTGQVALADDTGGSDAGGAAHHCHHTEACAPSSHTASVNLDLSSTTASVVFSGGHNAATVNIDVAGASQAVNAGQMLTPAQAVAAYQVMHGGVQNILLGTDGSAVGGSMVIGSHLAGMLNSLVIPTGVTVVDRTSTLNLAGDLTNSGTLLAVSTNPAITAATVSAANILNGQSGLLTTVLPDGGLASLGLSHYSNVVSNLSLSLNAVNNIVNSGIISSASDLNMTAGGSIQNVMASQSAITPIMQAAGTVSMLTPQITNAGTIQSLYGNINVLSSITSPNINITGSGGVMEALNGAINLRDALYTGSGNINLFGGDWLSQNLNLYSGTGSITAQIDQITGQVNSYAGAAHFSADTANLVLGNNCITGDPTYANTGDITINGNISPSEALAIIAGGNIIGNATSSISSNFAVTLVAGAHITGGGGTGGQTVTNGDPGVVTPVTYQFDNTAGGNIDFTLGSSNPVIVTGGGAATLLANSNSSTTGNIWFPTTGTSIQTNNTAGNGGNVLIVAGGSGGTAQSGAISAAIQLGAVSATATNNGNSAGSVTIYTAAPVITGGTATYSTTGTITAGSYPTSANSYSFNNSTISINGNVTTTGAPGTGGGTGVAGGNAGNGGSVTIQGGTIAMSPSTITTTGGTGGTGGGNAGGVGGAGGNSGNSGNVSLTAAGNITLTSIAASGPIGGAAGPSAIGAGSSGGTGGNAGTVSLTSTSGDITMASSILAVGGNGGFSRNGGTGGNGAQGAQGGASGSVTVSANSFTITSGNINTTGGTGSAGGNAGVGGSLGGAGASGKIGSNISITTNTSISIGGFLQANGGTGSSGGTTTGFSTSIVGGNGGNAGTIYLSTGAGGVAVGNNINAVGGGGGVGRSGSVAGSGGSGNTITVTTIGVALLNNISANGGSGSAGGSTSGGTAGNGGSGGSAGSITINAGDQVTIATTNANGGGAGIGGTSTPASGGTGGNGGDAGSINITTSSSITLAAGNINATGGNGNGGGSGGTTGGNAGNGGTGGSVTLTASRLQLLTDIITNGGTGGTGGTGTPSGTNGTAGVGGSISLTNSNTGTFTMGAATGTNYVGQLQANGRNGGTITVKDAGAVDIVSGGNGIVSAMNTVASGTGGNILFANTTSGGDVTVNNDGTIQVAQLGASSGIVGFSAGASGKITITGGGTITAGQYVNVGDVNTTTLAIQTPFTTVSPFTGTYTNTAGNIKITQASITGTLQVSDGPVPTPTPSSSSSSSSSSTTLYLALLQFGLLSQQLQAQLAQFNEQIGTRLATDYTPPLNVYHLQFPLQGNIQVDQLAGSGQALFSATSFTKDQLDALALQGIAFGPKTGGNFFDLNKGDVLFMPTSDIQVQTKEGIVTIPKGAVVWIMETGNDAAIYDMHDTNGNPVKLMVNNKELTLSPGKQILLTRDSKGSFDNLNPGKNIGTRNVSERDMGQGIKAYIADFTITGGICNVQVMRDMLKSNNPEHIKAAHNVLKNAAILNDLTGYKTPYKTKQSL